MNIPNCLTILRFVLAVGFVLFLGMEGWEPVVVAGGLFALAAFTDFYDGYFAKKYQLVSNFGKIMDPIADKFLILAAFFVFARMHIIAWWMLVVILIREAGITGLRLVMMFRGEVLAAERAGKIKTVFQMLSVCVILVFLFLNERGATSVAVLDWFSRDGLFVIHGLMWFTVALTVFSGLMVVRKVVVR